MATTAAALAMARVERPCGHRLSLIAWLGEEIGSGEGPNELAEAAMRRWKALRTAADFRTILLHVSGSSTDILWKALGTQDERVPASPRVQRHKGRKLEAWKYLLSDGTGIAIVDLETDTCLGREFEAPRKCAFLRGSLRRMELPVR